MNLIWLCKLLRVLQDGTFSRVGSNETQTADVRIVAATNKHLAEEVADGNFREDLYYRLNVVEIKIPPLRERPEDIPLLAEFFLRRITRRNGMARIRFSAEAVSELQQHGWPGNVRELENTVARACALAHTDILLPADIPLAVNPSATKPGMREMIDRLIAVAPGGSNVIEWLGRETAERAFARTDGDLKKAANLLGLTSDQLKHLLDSKPREEP